MTAKEFLLDYIQNHPDNKDENGNPYFETLEEFFREVGSDYFWSEVTRSSRWWDNLFAVQEFNDKLIGYEWARSTGDMSIHDIGWKFNEDYICFVEPVEVTITKYKKINGHN
jgi:hypothetical protein